MWYFGVFVCFCIIHLQNSQRVNIPLGKKGTSLSTLFRLLKGLWQPGTIPRETFPAGGELPLQPVHLYVLKSFSFQCHLWSHLLQEASSDSSNLPQKWLGHSVSSVLWNTEQFALYIFSSLIICPISPTKQEQVDLTTLVTLQSLLQSCIRHRLIIYNQWIEYSAILSGRDCMWEPCYYGQRNIDTREAEEGRKETSFCQRSYP